MYLEYFGLQEFPFSLAPGPRFLYLSGQHREALAHLLYGVMTEGGFVQLTGEVGTGKTTVCRCFLERLPEGTEAAVILNPRLGAAELVAAVCDEFGIPTAGGAASVKEALDRLNAFLLEVHARGGRAVLVVDEAQNLDPEALETVRLLTNLETSRHKLLQVVLMGQPELRETLARTELRQLAQRVTARFHLGPLSREETGAYLRHRLAVAGCHDTLFPADVVWLMQRLSGGVPRVVNILADRALLGAYTQGLRQVTPQTLHQASREVSGGEAGTGVRGRRLASAGAIAAAAALATLGVLWWTGRGPTGPPATPLSSESVTEVPAAPPPVSAPVAVPESLPGQVTGESPRGVADERHAAPPVSPPAMATPAPSGAPEPRDRQGAARQVEAPAPPVPEDSEPSSPPGPPPAVPETARKMDSSPAAAPPVERFAASAAEEPGVPPERRAPVAVVPTGPPPSVESAPLPPQVEAPLVAVAKPEQPPEATLRTAAGPATAESAPPSVPPLPAALAALLTVPEARDEQDATRRLFALLGAAWRKAGSEDRCEEARREGLDCLRGRGSWEHLLLHGHPGVVEVRDGAGPAWILLEGRQGEQVTLSAGGARTVVPAGRLAGYPVEEYLLAWRPGPEQPAVPGTDDVVHP